jgi:Ca2+-binding EF-hand superfamily protein
MKVTARKATRVTVLSVALGFASTMAFAEEPPTYKALDVDGDGSVNAEEFVKAQEGGVEKTFKEVDLDKDGKISKDEYESALSDCE